MESELKQNLSGLVKEYKKIKMKLMPEEQRYVEGRIKVAKTLLKNPKSPIYIDGRGDAQIGKQMYPRCSYCNVSLEDFRKPSERLGIPTYKEKYCSKSCMVQHSKMINKMKRHGANFIFWGKNHVKLVYNFKCNNPNRKIPHLFEVSLPIRKTRVNNYHDQSLENRP